MREFKGKSIIDFPSNYVVIDIETTGLSPEWDNIIEVAGIRYEDYVEVERFTSLVQPPCNDEGMYVDSYIEELTGITNEMLSSAPALAEVLPLYRDFIGSSIVIGHNVNFDINFIYDNFEQYLGCPFSNNYIDTWRISRKLHSEEYRHRLRDLISRYSLKISNSHRAALDCEATNEIYKIFMHEAIEKYGDLSSVKMALSPSKHALHASDIQASAVTFDTSHILYRKTCVFTGALEKMVRKDAMQLVVDLGGFVADSITKKTNFLIIGNTDYIANVKGNKTSKMKKAESLKLSGYDIEIIPENVFYELVALPNNSEDDKSEISESFDISPYTNGNDFSLTPLEVHFFQSLTELLSDSIDISKIRLEKRSDNYTSVIYGENNNFLRFKLTPKTKWLSINITGDDAKNNIDNPLFAAQKNKKQFHWKASINSIDDLPAFKTFIVNSCSAY